MSKSKNAATLLVYVGVLGIFSSTQGYAGNCFGCCAEVLEGQLMVRSDSLSMNTTFRKKVTLDKGTYNADVKFVSFDKAMKVQLTLENQKKVFKFKLKNSKYLRNDGEYPISQHDLGQPFDMSINRKTSEAFSQQMRGTQSCILGSHYETDYISDGNGNMVPQTRSVTDYGQQGILYRDKTTTVHYNFAISGSSSDAALTTSSESTDTIVDEVLGECH